MMLAADVDDDAGPAMTAGGGGRRTVGLIGSKAVEIDEWQGNW